MRISGRIKLSTLILATSLFTSTSFINCSKISVTDNLAQNSADGTNTATNGGTNPPPPTLSYESLLLETEMNAAIEFNLSQNRIADVQNIQLRQQDSHGQFEIVDLRTLKLRYKPEFGFRGKDSILAAVTDTQGNTDEVTIVVSIGNPVSDFQPSLAIRGMGCVQCHATINSNIITDFGYGNDYFFGQKPSASWWNNGGIYGDHAENFGSMKIPADKSIFLPKANIPANLNTGAATVAEYVTNKFTNSEFQSTRSVQIIEKDTIYIGAPTVADLTSSFRLQDTDRLKYFRNGLASLALQGVIDQGTFFEASDTVTCDGDLVLRGPLYIENLKLNTQVGCRIYVIGSVFIYGPIVYTSDSEKNNLQITSTKSINLGLGSVKSDASTFCNPNDNYALHTDGYGTSSLVNRYSTFWTVSGNFVRQSSTPADFGNSVVAESDSIAAVKGPLKDAVCREETRNVSFEHVLLNAPSVQSRYVGDFKGTVISEFAIMSLGQFKFEFDPVFQSVPIWPFLDSKFYLLLR